MLYQTTPTPALDRLKKLLNEDYFFRRDSTYELPTKLYEVVEQAIEESERTLIPSNPDDVRHIIERMLIHYRPQRISDTEQIIEDYVLLLQDYPYDLICASYTHLLKHYKYASLPKLADMVPVIEPEWFHRQMIRSRLDKLMKQVHEGRARQSELI